MPCTLSVLHILHQSLESSSLAWYIPSSRFALCLLCLSRLLPLPIYSAFQLVWTICNFPFARLFLGSTTLHVLFISGMPSFCLFPVNAWWISYHFLKLCAQMSSLGSLHGLLSVAWSTSQCRYHLVHLSIIANICLHIC